MKSIEEQLYQLEEQRDSISKALNGRKISQVILQNTLEAYCYKFECEKIFQKLNSISLEDISEDSQFNRILWTYKNKCVLGDWEVRKYDFVDKFINFKYVYKILKKAKNISYDQEESENMTHRLADSNNRMIDNHIKEIQIDDDGYATPPGISNGDSINSLSGSENMMPSAADSDNSTPYFPNLKNQTSLVRDSMSLPNIGETLQLLDNCICQIF